ncbi:Pyruvate dehydrogenase [acetyl-transferring]-phosphatase 1-like protein [Leptotrombidium deliense]|uniref:Pyruvate dehydrogenase [acetyl-transferring]-phosphatase 1-like protein n=1 Tax=Leptotrombidium deliense TaxID=299467 RepID=A0A443SS54_9ACAR|nr:Pyruvate dehydrogenase [acetyl-transferring]-phosphatase 1-like protein [Leptotrombidium deliense]
MKQLLLPKHTVLHFGNESLSNHFNVTKISLRWFASKQESYFSAIGGESDEPPPDLSPQQVTSILRRNEKTIYKNLKAVKLIECNQLAANHPVEDRLRISRINLNASGESGCSETLLLSVFDGHGGGACVDIISKRLFHYIALSLSPNPTDVLNNKIEAAVEDLFVCPKVNSDSAFIYDSKSLEKIKVLLNSAENECLQKFADELQKNPASDVKDALRKAFVHCDNDLAQEVEQHLSNESSSNIILHYYLSVAASGCCVTLLLIHNNKCYVASSGDCRAVLGVQSEETSSGEFSMKCIPLSKDHNSDNIKEIKRLYASHPANEQNNIIKNNRLLGHLMPLRAFGDYCYKWSVDKIKKVGLTRAFGPHIIPPHYYTPPYLIADPEITVFDPFVPGSESKKFVVLATDGLWEQFESATNLVDSVIKQQTTLAKKEGSESEKMSHKFSEGTSLTTINDYLTVNAKPQKTDFNDSLNIDGEHEFDSNCCTYLIRSALGACPVHSDPHFDECEIQRQHRRLVTFLTLPESVVRNFRDDISVILTHFK